MITKKGGWFLITGIVSALALVLFFTRITDSEKIELLLEEKVIFQNIATPVGFDGVMPEITVVVGGHLWRKDILIIKGRWSPAGDRKKSKSALDNIFDNHQRGGP